MRLLYGKSLFPAFLLVGIALVSIRGQAGTVSNSKATGSDSFFLRKSDEGTTSSSSSGSTSTSTSQSGTTTTINKKTRTGSGSGKGMMEKTALATGSVLCSAVYTPAKAIYAAGGTLTGSMVYLMSAGQSTTAASNIITRSTCGDWFVRPSHLSGERNLRFDAVPVDKKKRRGVTKKKS